MVGYACFGLEAELEVYESSVTIAAASSCTFRDRSIEDESATRGEVMLLFCDHPLSAEPTDQS